MSRALFCLVLATAALATACSGNRENLSSTAPAAAASDAPAATTLAAAPAGQVPPEVTVVDGNQLAQRSANSLTCRDLLVRGSNQMHRMCGTPEQWKTYDRREAELAAAQVRAMQRGPLRRR